jgi:hypothetical protein
MRPARSVKNKTHSKIDCPSNHQVLVEQMAQIFNKMALNGVSCRRHSEMTDKISESTVGIW